MIPTGLPIGQRSTTTHGWLVIVLILFGSIVSSGGCIVSPSQLPQKVHSELILKIRIKESKCVAYLHSAAAVIQSPSSVQTGHWANIRNAHHTLHRVSKIVSHGNVEFLSNVNLPVHSNYPEEDGESIFIVKG